MFKIYPILFKYKLRYRIRNFFCAFWYKNYAAIPCLGSECKKKIAFDFFFSSKFLIKITKEKGGATSWAVLTCPHCGQLFGFRLEAQVVNAKTLQINWKIRQTPPMSNEQFKKQFSATNN